MPSDPSDPNPQSFLECSQLYWRAHPFSFNASLSSGHCSCAVDGSGFCGLGLTLFVNVLLRPADQCSWLSSHPPCMLCLAGQSDLESVQRSFPTKPGPGILILVIYIGQQQVDTAVAASSSSSSCLLTLQQQLRSYYNSNSRPQQCCEPRCGMDLVVETVDGEPLERDKARTLSKKDKWQAQAAASLSAQMACQAVLSLSVVLLYVAACHLLPALFVAGFACLPWLWAVNVWMFWPDFKHGDPVVKARELTAGGRCAKCWKS